MVKNLAKLPEKYPDASELYEQTISFLGNEPELKEHNLKQSMEKVLELHWILDEMFGHGAEEEKRYLDELQSELRPVNGRVQAQKIKESAKKENSPEKDVKNIKKTAQTQSKFKKSKSFKKWSESMETLSLANQNIDKVLLLKSSKSSLTKSLVNLIIKKNISHSFVPIQRFERLKNKNHQGALAFLSPIKLVNIEELIDNSLKKNGNPTFILLDGITDVRNFGAIIRTAVAANIDGIIISQSNSAPINSDVAKTSSGTLFNIPISKVNNLKDAVMYLKASNIEIISLTEKAEKSIYERKINKPVGIILGSEDKGISKSLLTISDDKIHIPISDKVDSLNVSVAFSIMVFEVVKQKGL